MEYEDIGQSREWEDIEYINKGWSDDKKYKIYMRLWVLLKPIRPLFFKSRNLIKKIIKR